MWTTDKDRPIMDLLAAEITARTGKNPGEHYRELVAEFGTSYYTRIDAWSSAAALAIATLQDVLNLEDARMKRPGSADGNWRWRYTDHMLSASAFHSLTDLTHASARSGGMETPRTPDVPALLSPEVTR